MELDCKQDCCFSTEEHWFRYRAAAIIVENECVLLASNDVAQYFYSVGGGVHLGEQADEAVVREVFEEIGMVYEIDRLVVIHENFFFDNGIGEGKSCHEIAFYYLMKSKGNQTLNSHSYCAEGKEYMNWIPINELKNHAVYPAFFAELLVDSPQSVVHIVTKEY